MENNRVSLKDAGKKNKPEVITTSFNFPKEEYELFKENLKLMDVKVTDTFNEFIKRVNVVFGQGGGEVVFGIDLNPEQLKKRGGSKKK